MKQLLYYFILLSTLLPERVMAQKTKGTVVENNRESAPPRVFSLIVGISNYDNLPKLEYADNDALAFKDYLLQVQGVPPSRVHCLTNDSATAINIFDKLYLVADSLKPNDQFIFYFSGHGDWESKISDNSLLLLKKAPKQNYLRYPDQFINSQTLNDFVRKLAEQNITTFLIADACRSGNLVGGKQGVESTVLQLRQGFKNSIRILSCMPDELSFESEKWGGGRGVFSYYLTLGLMGIGKKETKPSLELTLGELRNFLEEHVSRETGGKQNPILEGDARFVVARINRSNADVAKALLTSTHTSVAVRGKGNIDTTNEAYRKLVQKFGEELQRGNLVIPEGHCAFQTYKQLLRYGPATLFDDKRTLLLEKIAANFTQFSEKYYDEVVYAVEDLVILRHEISTAMKLTANNPFLHNRFYSNRLFMDAIIALNAEETSPNKLVSRSQLDKAIDSLEKAIKLTPYEPFLYHMLGNCFLPVNPVLAIDHFNRYVSLLPNDPAAYNAIGFAYFQLKRYENAVAAFQKAISKNNKTSRYYYNLGICYQAMGRTDEAARMFKKSQNVGQPADVNEY